jgi:translation initiation factor 4E
MSSSLAPNSLSTSTTGWNAAKSEGSSSVSPLSDPNIKFPLENSWAFWFFKHDKSQSWQDNVKFITSVNYVEDFWGVYNHLQLASKLNPGCDFMVFKKDIPPMWEDPQNRDGGRWVLNIDKRHRTSVLDVYWLNTLLALIGDQFMDESPYVNGVWANIRARGDKISLWTKNSKNAELQMKIGRKFKEILGLKDATIVYEEHDESKGTKTEQGLYRC